MIKVIEGLAAMVWMMAMWFNVEGNRRVRSGGGGEVKDVWGGGVRSKRWLQGLVKVTCAQSGGEVVEEQVGEIWLRNR